MAGQTCAAIGLSLQQVWLSGSSSPALLATIYLLHAGSNVVSVAEHNVMLILTMLRNFLPAHEQIASGGWDVGAAAQKAYDLENKVVGIAGAGRIGQLTMERLKVRLGTPCRMG